MTLTGSTHGSVLSLAPDHSGGLVSCTSPDPRIDREVESGMSVYLYDATHTTSTAAAIEALRARCSASRAPFEVIS